MDRIRGDKYKRLAFERMMRIRKEKMYANKINYLMGMNGTNDIFSGHCEIQTILFLVTIIFVNMLTACHFGNILGLKFLLQLVLIFFYFTACVVATITHGDAKLHVNYSDLLMYMIQIIIFSTFIWIYIYYAISLCR